MTKTKPKKKNIPLFVHCMNYMHTTVNNTQLDMCALVCSYTLPTPSMHNWQLLRPQKSYVANNAKKKQQQQQDKKNT